MGRQEPKTERKKSKKGKGTNIDSSPNQKVGEKTEVDSREEEGEREGEARKRKGKRPLREVEER